MAFEHAEITDERIDEYSPATARLFRNMRDNIREVRAVPYSPAESATAIWTALLDTWQVALTIPIFVPDCMVGPGGTTLNAETLNQGLTGVLYTADVRLAVGATKGTAIEAVRFIASEANQTALSISFTPTVNTVVSLDIEVKDLVGGSAGGICSWGVHTGTSHIRANE